MGRGEGLDPLCRCAAERARRARARGAGSGCRAPTEGRRAAGAGGARAAAPAPLRLRVCTWNALGDALAFEHRGALYPGAPTGVLRWPGRLGRLARQVYLLRPDVLLLQEVDRYPEIEAVLRRQGYQGAFQQRHGKPDGCATFWRTWSGVRLVRQDRCLFHRFGLKNNVALLCVLAVAPRGGGKGRRPGPGCGHSEARLVVANTHIAFSPKRGDVKLGQVRKLVDAAAAAGGWSRGERGSPPLPVVLGGDFNATPTSGVLEFILKGALDLRGRDRRQLSGQLTWHQAEEAPGGGGASAAGEGEGGYPPESTLGWDAESLTTALGPEEAAGGGSCVRHGLPLRSAFADANGGVEPPFTTAHRRFRGTVDYLFYSAGPSVLRPLRSWTAGGGGPGGGQGGGQGARPPRLPHATWPSDHLALLCDFQLSPPAPPRD